MLLVKHPGHFILVNDEHSARCNRRGIPHAHRLTCQASLAKEVLRSQNVDDRLLASFIDDGEFHAAFLYIHDAFGRGTLNKDNLVFLYSLAFLATSAESRKAWTLNLSFLLDTLFDLLLLGLMI